MIGSDERDRVWKVVPLVGELIVAIVVAQKFRRELVAGCTSEFHVRYRRQVRSA